MYVKIVTAFLLARRCFFVVFGDPYYVNHPYMMRSVLNGIPLSPGNCYGSVSKQRDHLKRIANLTPGPRRSHRSTAHVPVARLAIARLAAYEKHDGLPLSRDLKDSTGAVLEELDRALLFKPVAKAMYNPSPEVLQDCIDSDPRLKEVVTLLNTAEPPVRVSSVLMMGPKPDDESDEDGQVTNCCLLLLLLLLFADCYLLFAICYLLFAIYYCQLLFATCHLYLINII